MAATVVGMTTSQRTQYYVAASLDGYIAETDHGLDWLLSIDDGTGTPAGEEPPADPDPNGYEAFIADIGALVMGAATYDVIAGGLDESWPYELPTFVYAHRERPVIDGLDVRFVEGDVGEHHAEMLEVAGGKNLWLVGGGALASQYLERGLIDDLILGVAPKWLGDGVPLFAARDVEGWTVTEARATRSGMAMLRMVRRAG
jgi:dihydrofolate reductase